MRRRDFLKMIASATVVATAGTALAACSQSSEDTSGSSDPSAKNDADAKGKDKDSTIRVGAIGAAGEEPNLDKAMSTAAWAALFAVYENLVTIDDKGLRFQLAKDAKPNDDATEWTITLRDKAAFSDGSPVTADDVLASMKSIANNPVHGMSYADIDVDASSAKDDSTVVVKLKKPRADFLDSVLGLNSLVFKGGDVAGLGSGPYVVESGDSATGWTLVANEHFPADERISDSLVIQVIADADARARAVDSGEIDLAMDLPSTAARSLSNAEAWTPGPSDSKGLILVLNTNVEPFNDPEVRHAMKIALDRKAMVETALDGMGEVGADVPGLGFEDYPSDLPEVKQDIDEAKKIFAEKGVTELTLVTADFSPGMNAGADVAAQQLKEAGVTVTVEKRDPTTYFADLPALMKLPLFASYLVNRSLQSAIPFITGSEGMFNMSGFGANPEWDARLAKAQAEVDDKKRAEAFADLARDMQENGGELIWGYANEIIGRTKGTPDVRIKLATPVMLKH